MKVAAVLISVLSVLVARSAGIELFNRNRFSLVTLPFKYYGIVPNFIDEAPKELLQVKWPDADCRLGNTLPLGRVNSVPQFSWDCSPNAYYTLLVADCDPLGKDNPLLAEVRYWAVGNIADCDFDTGEVIADYLPPTPIYNTPPHRFVYLIFRRSTPMVFEEPFITSTSIAGRVYSSIREFALKYDLGKPVAGNFCLIDYEKEPFDINYAKLDQPFPLYVRRAIEESDLSQPPS